jgi:uncharacterized protein (TIGR03118 family)
MIRFSLLARQALPTTLFAVSLALALPSSAAPNAYDVTQLVTDQPVTGVTTDADLLNPWGIAFNPNGFVWVANNHSGTSTLYDGNGTKNSLVVTIPPASGTGKGSPTGITYNGTNDFNVVTNVPPSNANPTPARFIFASEDGAITAWAPGITTAIVKVTANAVYKGIAIAGNGTANQLYAADFAGGKIDVYTSAYAGPITVPGGFADPKLPKGYAPFNIMNIQGSLYVAYAKVEEGSTDEEAGPGLGIVNVFDADGFLLKRLISHGVLNAPWGMALAPAGFGRFENMLLVGNFGDGIINAFDPATGAHAGRLRTSDHKDVQLDGLWGIAFGNGVQHQPTDTLFFAAGTGDEEHGLYGRIDASSTEHTPGPPPKQ